MLWQRLQELASVVKQQIQSSWPDFKMEKVARDRVYYHYNHTDACKHSRWTAKESYQFMYAMPWQQVVDFYSDVVNGRSLLRTLFGNATCVVDAENVSKRSVTKCCPAENKTGRLARVTYKIVLSYHGMSFDGWQKQPGLNTVQGVVEGSLGQFVDEKKAIQLQDNGLPIEGCAAVAGRTDKGVTAIQQVCSFYTWRKDVTTEAIEYSINSAAPRKLRVIHVTKVPRAFHPNFSAKWRRYLYIFPIEYGDERGKSGTNKVDAKNVSSMKLGDQIEECAEFTFEKCIKDLVINDKDELGSGIKPKRFSVNRVNQLLHQLEGKLLSYKVFARDTKASRNEGPATECFVYHARAAESRLPSSVKEGLQGTKVMCVELVANRFLRKMVRVLVATSIREAAAGAEEDALLKLTDATCRRATAPPAPPEGLCLVDVGYSDFDPRNSLIA